MTRRHQENKKQEDYLDKVFSFLRRKKKGDVIRVINENSGRVEEVGFTRRGRVHVSVFDLDNREASRVKLENVVLEESF